MAASSWEDNLSTRKKLVLSASLEKDWLSLDLPKINLKVSTLGILKQYTGD